MTEPATTPSRTVIITGAASERGIGRGVAHRLAAGGWSVGIIDLDQDAVDAAAAQLAADTGATVRGHAADVSDEGQVDQAFRRFEDELPPLVALVNLAGISDPTPFLDSTLAQWERVMRVNATGTYVTCRRAAPGMVERGHGRIVNFSSTAAQTGGGNYSKSVYAASKNAIEGLTRSIARELAPDGVTANTIAPASIDTDIMGGRITEERLPQFVGALPVGR
ncbi:SDR family NAD(P)-dependent oxidoreductase, partial [Streptomyces bacillaris]|uniref:SDR family NAD(P)-dependent oxidoreductase n=1 Tax=Streptomyces bacillaris TaxID=68179 RepID=UPI0036DC32B8